MTTRRRAQPPRLSGARDLFAQLVPGQAPLDLVFAPKHHGRTGATLGEEVFGKIELRAGKEASVRHPLCVNQVRWLAFFTNDVREIPQPRPKLGRLIDRVSM